MYYLAYKENNEIKVKEFISKDDMFLWANLHVNTIEVLAVWFEELK